MVPISLNGINSARISSLYEKREIRKSRIYTRSLSIVESDNTSMILYVCSYRSSETAGDTSIATDRFISPSITKGFTMKVINGKDPMAYCDYDIAYSAYIRGYIY